MTTLPYVPGHVDRLAEGEGEGELDFVVLPIGVVRRWGGTHCHVEGRGLALDLGVVVIAAGVCL